MLEMPENTGFTGNVVADWLQKCVINLLSDNLNMYDMGAAEKSAASAVLLFAVLCRM